MKTIASGISLILLLAAAPLAAQEDTADSSMTVTGGPEHAFVEATGGYGFQFGQQPYVPTTSGSYKHPLTNGYAVGASAGWTFIPGLSLIGNWEYASAQSRDGKVTNALDTVEGTVDYHTLALGLRWARDLGPGRLYGELGAGVVLPFETVVHYDYASAMSAVNISGSGHMVNEYNMGFGAYGQLGYQWSLPRGIYVGTSLRIRSFQSNNDGKQTRYENFVANMSQPAAMNVVVKYDSDGAAGTQAPTTYSVQDLRFQLALGFRL